MTKEQLDLVRHVKSKQIISDMFELSRFRKSLEQSDSKIKVTTMDSFDYDTSNLSESIRCEIKDKLIKTVDNIFEGLVNEFDNLHDINIRNKRV